MLLENKSTFYDEYFLVPCIFCCSALHAREVEDSDDVLSLLTTSASLPFCDLTGVRLQSASGRYCRDLSSDPLGPRSAVGRT